MPINIMQPLPKRFNDILLGAILLLASLWDFRHFGVRVLDVAALILCTVIVINNYKNFDFKRFNKTLLPPIFIVMLWSLYGYWSYSHKSSFAIIAGLGLFTILVCQREDFKRLIAFAPVVLLIHLAFFWAQYLLYYTIDYSPNFFDLFEGASRNLSTAQGGVHFRPSGLFQEPNSFSLCVFMLASLCVVLKHKLSLLLVFFAAFSMMISQSLWGVIATLGLFVSYALINDKIYKKQIAFLVTSFCAVFVIFWGSLFLLNPDSDNSPQLLKRFENILSSGSFRERFVSNTLSEKDIEKWTALAQKDWQGHPRQEKKELSVKLYRARIDREEKNKDLNAALMSNYIIGHGFSTKPFEYGLPLNTFAFLWNSMGLGGLFALLLGIGVIVRRFKVPLYPDIVNYVGVFVLIFLSYPIFTYSFLWFWLFGMVSQSSLHIKVAKFTKSVEDDARISAR